MTALSEADLTVPIPADRPVFKVGDRINVTITGATIDDNAAGEADPGLLWLVLPNGTRIIVDVTSPDEVTVERGQPAQWPPKPGDLWRDKFGKLWFRPELRTRTGLMFLRENGDSITEYDDQLGPADTDLWNDWGPLTLVHRDEFAGGAS